MSARIDHLVTSGTFSLDGGTWDVENNVWVIGNDDECVIVDAPHSAKPILEAVAGRTVKALLLTHAHDDHVSAAGDVRGVTGAPVLLHPADRMLWDVVHPDAGPDAELADGQVGEVGGAQIHVLHTPGHTPGSCSFYLPALHTVLTGDTLFAGGPGATGRSFSDFGTIIDSIRDRLLALPPETVVRTGHGEMTTVGDEAPHLHEWIHRGH